MSIPSSRLLVATRAGSRPSLSASSISRRCSRAMLPWWARTSSSPARSLSRWARRSARRRLLVKTIVLWWARMSSRIRGWIAGQMLVRMSSRQAGPPGWSSSGRTSPSRLMSSTGTTTSRSSALRVPASTIATSRPAPMPPRNRAIVSSGRCVAESPIRWSGGAAGGRRRSSRSRDRARWAPRFVPATAWTSSRMTVSTPRSVSRAAEVRIRYRLSGVVTRMSGGVFASWRRASWGVSPVRDAIEMCGGVRAEPLGRERDPVERRPEVALDVVGQRLERRDVQDADAARSCRAGAVASGGEPADRGTTGTRRGSCPSRSGRGSACGGPPRSTPSRPSGPASAPRTRLRTTPAPGRRTVRAGRLSGRAQTRSSRAEQCSAHRPIRPDVLFSSADVAR